MPVNSESLSAIIFVLQKERMVVNGMLIIHPRIHERHPDIDENDVVVAWGNSLASAPRLDKDPNEYATVGKRNADGNWLIYHAMTPPTKKMRKELAKAWRCGNE